MLWLSVALVLSAYFVIWMERSKIKNLDLNLALCVTFLVLYLLFHHINTEYYIFALPLFAVLPFLKGYERLRVKLIVLHFALGIVSTSYDVILGIRVYAVAGFLPSHSKEIALNAYNKLLGFIPMLTLEMTLLVATITILAVMSAILLRGLFEKPVFSVTEMSTNP
jgi:hypothetical protein